MSLPTMDKMCSDFVNAYDPWYPEMYNDGIPNMTVSRGSRVPIINRSVWESNNRQYIHHHNARRKVDNILVKHHNDELGMTGDTGNAMSDTSRIVELMFTYREPNQETTTCAWCIAMPRGDSLGRYVSVKLAIDDFESGEDSDNEFSHEFTSIVKVPKVSSGAGYVVLYHKNREIRFHLRVIFNILSAVAANDPDTMVYTRSVWDRLEDMKAKEE